MLSGEVLIKHRLKLWRKMSEITDNHGDHVFVDSYHPDVPFTCDSCLDNETCKYRFDSYNTNGDCLASK